MNPVSLTVAPKEILFANDKKAVLEKTVVITNNSPCEAVWTVKSTNTKTLTPKPLKGTIKREDNVEMVIQFQCDGNKEKVKHDYITIYAYEPGSESEKQMITKIKVKYFSEDDRPADCKPEDKEPEKPEKAET